MALLMNTDGRTKEIHPVGAHWTLAELQGLVGGYIEVVRTVDGEYMVINETGKLEGMELNIPATRIYLHGRRDVIVGPAVVVATKEELDGPDDRDDDGGVH